MKIIEVCCSDSWPKFWGPFGYYFSDLWIYEDGKKDWALSIWLWEYSIYFQFGKKWKLSIK